MDNLVQAAHHLTGLPTELLCLIFEFLPLGSHFAFALSCKTVYSASSDMRKRHEAAYAKYRVTSDLDPATVPFLLRSAFGFSDPIPAWHVRSFEMWFDRMGWDEWKTVNFDKQLREDTETPTNCWKPAKWEKEAYTKFIKAWDEENGTTNEALEQIASGRDGFIKALLIATCPRIRDVKLVPNSNTNFGLRPLRCFQWLDGMIGHYAAEPQAWMAGLQSLQSVAVGVWTDTWLDHDEQATNNFLNLLLLPKLESLYVRNPAPNNPLHIWPESSTLSHIFLDGVSFLDTPTRHPLIRAPENLVSAAFRMDNDPDWNEAVDLVDLLRRHHGQTLENLMFYGPKWNIHSGTLELCEPEKEDPMDTSRFAKIRNVSMDLKDLTTVACEERHGVDVSSNKYDEKLQQQLADFFESYFPFALPKSIETLTFWNGFESHFGERCSHAFLGRGLTRLVESDRYPNLKAIYLEEVEQDFPDLDADPWGFAAVIEAGKRKGVDIYTARNKSEKLYTVDFPEGIEKWDMATSPWMKPEGLVFNNYLGRRVEPGRTSGCGDCVRCAAYEMGVYNISIEEYRGMRGPIVDAKRKDPAH